MTQNATTPMTIPAMAPPLNDFDDEEDDEAIGRYDGLRVGKRVMSDEQSKSKIYIYKYLIRISLWLCNAHTPNETDELVANSRAVELGDFAAAACM